MKDHDSDDPAGPQGTRVFSGDEVRELLDEPDSQAGLEGKRVRLVGRGGPVEGREFPVRDTRLILGRSDGCDVVIDDASVSSEHARLSRDAAGWRVVNLLSTNGTFVNDKRVSGSPLKDGDILRLGRAEFVFRKPVVDPEPDGASSVFGRLMMPLVLVGAAVVLALALVGLYRLI